MRDAIDHELGVPTWEGRRAGFERLQSRRVAMVSPANLRAMIDGQFDDEVADDHRRRR